MMTSQVEAGYLYAMASFKWLEAACSIHLRSWLRFRYPIITALIFANPVPAMAETFDAVYRATLAGIPVGSARLSGDEAAGAYAIRIKGEGSLLGFSTRFEASSNGTSRDNRMVPADFRLRTEGRAVRTVAVKFAADRAASVTIEPQPGEAEQDGRFPIEPLHLKDVLDPMSAMMTEILRASRSENPCIGLARVFTGSMRFDMALAPSSPVSPGQPADEIVCRANYQPIAGHKPSSRTRPLVIAIAYPKDIKAGETRLPVRIEVPLPMGTMTIRRTS